MVFLLEKPSKPDHQTLLADLLSRRLGTRLENPRPPPQATLELVASSRRDGRHFLAIEVDGRVRCCVAVITDAARVSVFHGSRRN